MKKTNNNLLSLASLVRRNIGIFLKDKMMVFFSVLTPMLVLILYIVFLGDMQVGNIINALKDVGLEELGKENAPLLQAVINNWMIAGVLGVSCVTVALNACTMMVRDRATRNINDVLAAPVKRWVLYSSYIISCFIITFCICFAILILSVVYLACSGGLMMNFLGFLSAAGVILLSVASSSVILVLIISFIKSESALTAFSGFFSAAIGFFMGAYLPFNMMPKAVQYVSYFIPGTYGAGLFRNIFMQGPMRKLISIIPPDKLELLQNGLLQDYSIDMNFFGHTVRAGHMVLALGIFIVITVAMLFIMYSNKHTNFFNVGAKRRKRKNKKKKA